MSEEIALLLNILAPSWVTVFDSRRYVQGYSLRHFTPTPPSNTRRLRAPERSSKKQLLSYGFTQYQVWANR